MKRKLISLLAGLVFCTSQCFAQSSLGYFHSIGTSKRYVEVIDTTQQADLGRCSSDQNSSSGGVDYRNLSVAELETLIRKYERSIFLRDSLMSTKFSDCKGKLHSYYNWNPRELNLENLMDVVHEVGLSNKLFVLAQALLETGNFSSKVCKEYNNLFGLYDSKHREYYRFARWEDSVVGYRRMIQYRYKGGNYLHFLRRIGYAEDPRYITKVAQLAKNLYHKLSVK